MTEALFPWTGPTLRAKGRGMYNADAIGTDLTPDAVYIINRVASTGGTNHGWGVMPRDPKLLREFAEHLNALAAELEALPPI